MKQLRTCVFCGEGFWSCHPNAAYCTQGCTDQVKLLKAKGIPLRSREHAIAAREWRIKQHHKLHTTRDRTQRECIPCLVKLGMGCKRIGGILRMNAPGVSALMNRMGFADTRRERRKVRDRLSIKTPQLSADDLIMEGYAIEAAALARFDEQRHWGEHAKANSWMASKYMMAKYRSDPVFRAKHNKKTLRRRQANPVRTAALKRAWVVKREKADPAYRLKNRICSTLSALLGGRRGSWSKIQYYLGCTTEQLKAHMQAQFQRHMDWNNYGKVWHIDHIVPLSRFDHSKDEQIKTCWNWQNLRPMWARANVRKNDKLTKPQMHLSLQMR